MVKTQNNLVLIKDARTVTPEQVDDLAMRMHASDRREIEAVSEFTALEALQESLRQSTAAWIAVDADTDEMVAAFGVTGLGLMSRNGMPWLLRTDQATKYARSYVALSPTYLELMLKLHPVLANLCGVWAKDSARWLESLGFEVGPALPIGRNGEKMRRFELARI